MFCFPCVGIFCFVLHWGTWSQWASTALALSGIPSLLETADGLCRIENVTSASADTGVSSKWVKLKFLLNYPFHGISHQLNASVCNLQAYRWCSNPS